MKKKVDKASVFLIGRTPGPTSKRPAAGYRAQLRVEYMLLSLGGSCGRAASPATSSSAALLCMRTGAPAAFGCCTCTVHAI